MHGSRRRARRAPRAPPALPGRAAARPRRRCRRRAARNADRAERMATADRAEARTALDSRRPSGEHRPGSETRPTMTIQLLFFAQARERAGSERATLELPEGSRVRDALAKIRERYPALVELMPHLAVAVNQRLVGEEEMVLPGAELALLPPVSGGAMAKRGARALAPAREPATGAKPSRPASVRVVPVTPTRWSDLEKLFGPRGACAGCWCMWCRLPGKEFQYGKGDGNKRRLRRLVLEGPPPGLIGYF